MPGCKKMEAKGDDTYELVLMAGVGPIKGEYEGTVRLADIVEPTSFRMIVEAKGKTGFVTGEGVVELTANGSGSTVTYIGEVTIGGKIAAVGQRMHSSAAKLMTRQLFGAIEAEAQAEEGVEVKHGLIRDTLRGIRRK
jgi:carbon monoxide dehydrogenase subunit G